MLHGKPNAPSKGSAPVTPQRRTAAVPVRTLGLAVVVGLLQNVGILPHDDGCTLKSFTIIP